MPRRICRWRRPEPHYGELLPLTPRPCTYINRELIALAPRSLISSTGAGSQGRAATWAGPWCFGVPEYLTIINLLILIFTTYWSYRYTRIGRRIRSSEQAPSESHLIGTVWTGVVATTAGMLFSMISILIDAANLLFFFLKAPQAGI